MKVPVSWLVKYVDAPPTEEILRRLTEIGHMVEGPVELTDRGPMVSLEIRQNRPDCLSILGIAREVSAAFGSGVREPRLAELPGGERRTEHPRGEDHVCFLHIRGVRSEVLPEGMLGDLESYGQRSVGPLVDLANYVMIELGQPLHVYAAEGVELPSARSRSGRTGEMLRLLDGRTVELSEDDLVIADPRGPLALAGVMGGGASAVASGGGDIVVEAGTFRPHLVRRTARRHGLATEASLRSSKLLPAELVEVALARFLALLTECGHVEEIELWRSGPMPDTTREAITLACGDIRRISGVPLPPVRSVEILSSLGFAATARDDGTIAATPLWWRTDVAHPADLIEEILRIEGYSQIRPDVLPALARTAPAATVWDQEEAVREMLCAWGYDEAILDSFLMDRVGGVGEGPEALRVENPPAGNGVLRPSLLPNMLSGARFLHQCLPNDSRVRPVPVPVG
ncbi:MAG: phenylalanine--tRNA ligase beta subunit-related protein [Chloroflexota bacterium]|nr:phenylalanine--tRNA ligase beta subunit-related protein [Chloroflexota bacterium]